MIFSALLNFSECFRHKKILTTEALKHGNPTEDL